MTEATVSAQLFISLMEVYRKTLGDSDLSELRLKVDEDFPENISSDQRVPVRLMHHLVEYLARKLNDPVFGLRWSECTRAPVRPQVLTLFLGAQSLRQLLDLTCRYTGLLSGAFRLQLLLEKNRAFLELAPASQFCGRHQVCAQLMGLRKVVAMVKQNALKSVKFTHSCPAGFRDFYEKAFGIPVFFEQGSDGLELHPHALAGELPFSRVCAEDLIHTERRLSALRDNPGGDVVSEVRTVTSYLLDHGITDRQSVALVLGISLRTMQRRLRKNNTNYRDILDRIRFEKAHRLMQLSCYSGEDMAFLLGYQDIRSYYHASRRWLNSPPASFVTP